MASVIIFGAYGVFGSKIAEALAPNGIPLILAGRNLAKARHLAERLGGQARAREADVTGPASCRAALKGQSIAVHCAGPFSVKNLALAEACLETGCHYVDIADDRGYIANLQGYHERFLKKNLSAVYGASSLPGISGALATRLTHDRKENPQAIRVTLWIGHRNPKGSAAVEALLKIAGKTIRAPQGDLRGLGHKGPVKLPEPLGRVPALVFESPEYDLFPERFSATAVEVTVSFEWKAAVAFFSMLSRCPSGLHGILKPVIRVLGNAFGSWGSSGGAVDVRMTFPGGGQAQATALAEKDGQHMAVVPAVLSVEELAASRGKAGVRPAFEFLESEKLLRGLERKGFKVVMR